MAFPLLVEIQPTSLRLGRGDSAEVEVRIRNVSEVVEHYAVSVVGLGPDELESTQPELIKLLPGKTANVRLRLTVPAAGGAMGGSYVLGVLVRSPQQPEVSRAAELILEVVAETGLTLAVAPEIAYGSPHAATYQLTLRNEGNIPLHVGLEATDQEGRSSFTFDPAVIDVAAGSERIAQMQVRSRAPWTGQERRRQLTVRGMVDGQMAGSVPATFAQKPRLAAGLIRALGAALSVAIIAGAVVAGVVLANRGNGNGNGPGPEDKESGGNGDDAQTIELAAVQVSGEPMVGEPVRISVSADGDVTEWSWRISNSESQPVATWTESDSFEHTFTAAGSYQVTVTATGPGGDDTARKEVEVAEDKSPREDRISIVEESVTMKGGESGDGKASCPAGRVALGGGVSIVSPNQEGLERPTELVLLRSAPAEDGQDWRGSVRNESEGSVTVAVVALCVERPAGYAVVTDEVESFSAPKRIEVACPAGTAVYGGGFDLLISDALIQGPLEVSGSAPAVLNEGRRGWRVLLSNPTQVTTSSELQQTTPRARGVAVVSAVCGRQLPGYVMRPPQQIDVRTGEDIRATVTCDGAGVAVGGGAAEVGGGEDRFALEIGTTSPTDGSPPQSWRTTFKVTDQEPHVVSARIVCVADQQE